MNNILIKICGITDSDAAIFCARAGADYIGLVFEKTSPRYLTLDQAKPIVHAAHQHGIIPVAVFGKPNHAMMIPDLLHAGFSAIQSFDPVIGESMLRPVDKSEPFILLDSANPGTGTKLDWSNIKRPTEHPFFLAGGLTPDNVEEAMNTVRPHGVDVSSGVESSRGVKDKDLIVKFIQKARAFHHE